MDEDILNGQKKILHMVEHALDNQNIDVVLKNPLSKAYVDIFTLFSPDSYSRLISKSKYFFNVK